MAKKEKRVLAVFINGSKFLKVVGADYKRPGSPCRNCVYEHSTCDDPVLTALCKRQSFSECCTNVRLEFATAEEAAAHVTAIRDCFFSMYSKWPEDVLTIEPKNKKPVSRKLQIKQE